MKKATPTGRIRPRYNANGELSFYQIILYLGRDYKNKKKEKNRSHQK